jgi:ubiquitin-protein ligase
MSATKRAMADMVELQKPLYNDTGIYYMIQDENVLLGQACIFGPPGTPYEDCPMVFEFSIPSTYPFDPPNARFLTYDGVTRFHPNMYKDGKVCLSILHTWEGPKWASTMRLSTILVTLQSLMDTSPLRHEPGYETGRDDLCKAYAKAVEISCLRYILARANEIVSNYTLPKAMEPFREIFEARLPGVLDRCERRIRELSKGGEFHLVNLPYKMECRTGYSELLESVVKLKDRMNASTK